MGRCSAPRIFTRRCTPIRLRSTTDDHHPPPPIAFVVINPP
eukprot:NODE_2801_length_537_cov_149.098361_g2415_i0.p3 GENE.NODE_2801_length_537_cov_149.098361_g2415_i0~~NODE_2801_length_537_cov_149.098361_g2415_i0.p3  ORF type:complete len:50 (-),score=13.75 NODE_2801_length_537_cov_149.098361_g2415_i0:388-510(-)